MNRFLFSLVAALACHALAAAPGDDEAKAERVRITAERAQAQARFTEQEKACYGKFAVNDCLNEARAQRRQVLADLKRQETALNDAERRRRAAERQRDLEERSSAQNQEQAAARRSQAVAEQKQRADRAAEKAARAASAAAQPPKARVNTHEKKDPMPASEAVENARRHEERVEQAKERKERVQTRQSERTKPSAAPLPVPP
jgi:colicin import membrane protein